MKRFAPFAKEAGVAALLLLLLAVVLMLSASAGKFIYIDF